MISGQDHPAHSGVMMDETSYVKEHRDVEVSIEGNG
jgi:hypothetical protein